MIILHVCLSGPFYEGYAYQDNLLPKYHRRLGHDVTIIAPVFSEYDKVTGKMKKEGVGTKQIGDGIKLIRIPAILPYRLHQHIHLYRHLRKTVESLRAELIFVHSVACLDYRFFHNYKQEHPEVKIVFDNHADSENSGHNKLSYYYGRFVIRNLIVKRLVNDAEWFYGVTPARCSYLNERYGVPLEKIKLLPMGADDEQMHFSKKCSIREVIRKEYGICEDDFLIVTGGKIDPLKNIHVLAEAVNRSKYKDIKLLIFGSIRDDMKEIFKRLASERIQCIGWVSSKDVYRYFYAADIVMFPGLHSVLWEQAVASQVPIAVSRINGFDHIDIGGNCFFLEEKTWEYYLTVVERLFIDKDFYRKLKMAAQSNFSEQFLYGNIAQQVIDDCFNKLL